MWSGSHPLCRTSSTKQQGFIQPVFTPLVDADGMKKKVFYYYILLLCGCFEIGPSPCLLSVMRKTVQKSSPVYLKHVSTLRARPLCLSVVIYSFVLISLHSAAWLKSVTPSSGLRTVRGGITWRTAWYPGRRPVGGGSTSRCSVSASPRTSWRWRRRRTPFGHTCLETGNGTGEYLWKGVLKYGVQ